ncbi:hypothetical protein N7456_006484 [Penicillium angulare]|uniref:Uncharacterized protein n=1 Tax=Penicillium angulare TaxID=116970 RepID=A0A9W9FI60_9EURO|nr:hypothetical protein N7456_006484 [Penicillium angulare]
MSFQDILPPDTPRYKYESYDQCLEILDQQSDRLTREEGPLGCAYNPYFIIDIEEDSFQEYFVNSGEKILTLSWEIYDHEAQSALFKMETAAHAVAARTFDIFFAAWARKVDDPLLSVTPKRTFRGKTRSKKADISWTISGIPEGRSKKWPTFIGEVAWSGHRAKLKGDVGFWLNDPDSYAKVVISISVFCDKVMVESWERSDESPSPVQMIQIIRDPRPGCPQVNGHLEIQFSDIFGRDKTDEESNFRLTEPDMEILARNIWAFQYPTHK